jgi:glycosyltransferase involved in cell wall biosynthesis
VLGSGSISGVDARRFRPDHEARLDVRAELSIPADAQVILFLGRLKKEKGVSELAAAFARLAASHPDVHLLLVGPDEESLLEGVLETCAPFADRVRNVGYTFTPERYIAASEILALPSHREGFGSVIIEAAAAGVPAVASRIYGISDAIVDETTGLMHEAANPVDLARQLERLLADEVLRVKLGTQARERALREFTQQRVCELIAAFYQDILQ